MKPHPLLSAQAVRQRCHIIGQAALENRSLWFLFNPEKLDPCIELVAAECQTNYPDLNIPYHSRWRHFVVGGVDLWQHYAGQMIADASPLSRCRTAIDLAFVSVLLDAGAGDKWQYLDPVTGTRLSRSEGLAAATVDLFFNHLAQQDGEGGLQITAETILGCTASTLADGFQHRTDNPLLGMDGRVRLLKGLGKQLQLLKQHGISRPGNILDKLLEQRHGQPIGADRILELVLQLFNDMWPSGLVVNGVSLGDCGQHQLIVSDDETNGIVPFHKLSQWLTYSLLEPLQWAGITVTDLDQLTGLPEYRNGGVLLDMGVLTPLAPELPEQELSLLHESVVEWRALTVWLLDQIAAGVREKLGRTDKQMPLAAVLQGGTWSAGRKLAEKMRGGLAPIKLGIDGTVF